MRSTLVNGVLTLSVVFICVLIAVFIALSVTRSIYSPITDLQTEMEKVGKGVLDIELKDNDKLARDELGVLTVGFIDMVQRLKKLIDDVYHSRIKEKELEFLRKEAELNALQQQINPHFLYNTLETIFWAAQLKGEDEIAEMVTALGDFFRTSINKGLEYLSIDEEISNVKNYVYLQKIRFGNRFEVKWDIDENILKYKTIKLILQPIIENAIVHGIENLASGGLIIIKGYFKKDTIVFEIIDNGIGMSEKEVKELEISINKRKRDVSKSIGVENVNQRIKLYFGEKYGVSIKSRKGEGTTIIVLIPSFENELHTNFPVS